MVKSLILTNYHRNFLFKFLKTSTQMSNISNNLKIVSETPLSREMSTRERKVVRKKKKFGVVVEYVPTVRVLFPDEETMKKINGEIKRTRGITPQYLADKYNIRVSTAKRILKEAEEKKIIECVISNKRTRVYQPVSSKE